VDLALGPILFDEPVETKRLCILFARDPENFRRLRFESLELACADLQMRVQFQVTHKSSFSRTVGAATGNPARRWTEITGIRQAMSDRRQLGMRSTRFSDAATPASVRALGRCKWSAGTCGNERAGVLQI
jgi:hypothetical protein